MMGLAISSGYFSIFVFYIGVYETAAFQLNGENQEGNLWFMENSGRYVFTSFLPWTLDFTVPACQYVYTID
jgi:hypothetical protein